MVVEHSFGELKNRFRRCQDVDAKIEKAVNIVISSCVLHNICIQKGDINRESYDPIPLHCNVNPNRLGQRENQDSSALLGQAKREQIRTSFNVIGRKRNVIAFARR